MVKDKVHAEFDNSQDRGWAWPFKAIGRFVQNQIKKVSSLVTTATKVFSENYRLDTPTIVKYQTIGFIATAGAGLYLTYFSVRQDDEDNPDINHDQLSKICLIISLQALENYYAVSSKLLERLEKYIAKHLPIEAKINHAIISGASNGVVLATNVHQYFALRELSLWITRAVCEGNTYALPSGMAVFFFAVLSNSAAHMRYRAEVVAPQKAGQQIISTTDGHPKYPTYLQSLLMILPSTCTHAILKNTTFIFQFVVAEFSLKEGSIGPRYINCLSLLSSILPQAIREINEYFIRVSDDEAKNSKLFGVVNAKYIVNDNSIAYKQRRKLKPGDVISLKAGENGVELIDGVLRFTAEFSGIIFSTRTAPNASVNRKALTGEDKSISVKIYKQAEANKIAEISAKEALIAKTAITAKGMEYQLVSSPDVEYFLQIKTLKDEPGTNLKITYRTPPHMAHEQKHASKLILFAGYLSAVKGAEVIYRSPADQGALNIAIEALKGTLHCLFVKMQCVIPLGTDFIIDGLLMRHGRLYFKNKLAHKSLQRILSLYAVSQGLVPDMSLALVSDKTGTLTLPGVYYDGMMIKSDKQLQQFSAHDHTLDPNENFDNLLLFVAAYTNSRDEPEENAVLDYLKQQGINLEIRELAGGDSFEKTLIFGEKSATIQSFHLGLYVGSQLPLGGRLTLVTTTGQSRLVFFGIPGNSPVFDVADVATYVDSTAKREHLITRDWGLFSCTLSRPEAADIMDFYTKNMQPAERQKAIYAYIKDRVKFKYHLSVHIHNKLKPGVHDFVNAFNANSGFFMLATGDTYTACNKLAKIITPNCEVVNFDHAIPNATQRQSVIFTGFVPERHGECLLQLLKCAPQYRPLLFFCAMSMEEKGALANFLAKHKFFVIANGDAMNDTQLVANSDFSIVHGADDNDTTQIKGDICAFDLLDLTMGNAATINAHSIYETNFLDKNSPLMLKIAKMFMGIEQVQPAMTIFKANKCGPMVLLKGPGQLLPAPPQAKVTLINLIYDAACYFTIFNVGMSRTNPTFVEPLVDRGQIVQAQQIIAILSSSLVALSIWAFGFEDQAFGASMALCLGISLMEIGTMLGRFADNVDEQQVADKNAALVSKKKM